MKYTINAIKKISNKYKSIAINTYIDENMIAIALLSDEFTSS